MRKFCFVFIGLLMAGFANAQTTIAGTWQGKLTLPGSSLRVVVHIKNENGNYTATLDSPDQGAKGIPVNNLSLQGDSLYFALPAANAKYSGLVTSDTTINGEWFQGRSLPLNLTKQNEGQAIAELKRPQTPTPPFPYESREVIYDNKDKSIQYGATVTKPQGKGPFPAVLLLTGSGQQNRDEELFGHKPFAVLADYLTRKGFVVLRVDDRGVGQTTGEVKNATSKDFAADAIVGFNYLKSLPEVNQNKLGLLGHSEGGMLAEMIAAQRKDVDFVILLAAPGEKVIDLMAGQNKAVLQSVGVSKENAEAYASLYKPLALVLSSPAPEESVKKAALQIINKWISKTPRQTVLATTGIRDEESKEAFVNKFYKGVSSPWFRYFLHYNPEPYVKKISASVLALNGSKDIQVPSKPNLASLKAALQKSPSKQFDVMELSGLNHLFQHCKKCTVNEYGELEETFAPEALEAIGQWLEKYVKEKND